MHTTLRLRILALAAAAVLLLGIVPAQAAPARQGATGPAPLARGQVAQRPFAVMIDNHPDAYPQTGVGQASVVFEALAEYGITRFMAVYAPGASVPTIGPVRSARLYFVQWAMGMRAVYAHAGGSPQALSTLGKTTDVVNLDALLRASGSYFGRSSKRAAPHNLFTSSADLARAAANLKQTDISYPEGGYLYKADAPAAPQATKIDYFFLYKQDPAGWTYDAGSNSYLRTRRGKPAVDAASGKQLSAKNVVVIEVRERKIAGDPKGRIEQDVIGSGAGFLFQDGQQVPVTWRKDSASAPLIFTLADGSEAQFNQGQVWIAVVPNIANLSVK